MAPARAAPVTQAYRAWLKSECGGVELLGMRLRHGQAVRLNHIYVPVTTAVLPVTSTIPSTGTATSVFGWWCPHSSLNDEASGLWCPQVEMKWRARHALQVPKASE